jgi:hypothetical protein
MHYSFTCCTSLLSGTLMTFMQHVACSQLLTCCVQQGTVKSSIVKCMRCANAYHDTCLRDIIFLRKGKYIVCDQHELDASELAMREVSYSTDMSRDMLCMIATTQSVYM